MLIHALVLTCVVPLSRKALGLQVQKPDSAARNSSQQHVDFLAEQVKDAFRHAWRGYMMHAAGHDDLRPLSGGHSDWLCAEITLLDALSTMWLMGLQEEFEMAKHRVASLRFHLCKKNIFETTIRGLGGLCSAHSLSGDALFLQKAVELAELLLPGLTGRSDFEGFASLAERGSIQLEFRYLSQQTGNQRYQRAADHVYQQLLAVQVDSMGRGTDSFYEYLLKLYLQSGKRETELKHLWIQSMQQMRQKLVQTTTAGSIYISVTEGAPEMDQLSCFVGGMLALGTHNLEELGEARPALASIGEGVVETCFKMSRMTRIGLAPEKALFFNDSNDMRLVGGLDDTHMRANFLRPEIAESLFYQHYYTGDPKYRQWASEMFIAFNTTSRTKFGFAEVVDIGRNVNEVRLQDTMQSYFLAETLLYLYLTFAHQDVIDLDEFVFSTEGHPLRIDRNASISFDGRFDIHRTLASWLHWLW